MQNITQGVIVTVAIPSVKSFMDLTGHTYAQWTVIGFAGSTKIARLWWCKCSCGKTGKVSSNNLRSGHSKSCGCHCRARTSETHTRHGMSDTRTHRSWMSMIDRCQNPNCTAFKNYGGRGIRVCQEWNSFEAFLADMGECPPDKTLDRIDNEKGYCKENCRWATWTEQQSNKRNTKFVNINGERLLATVAADRFGVKYKTLMKRIYDGWPDHEAVLGRGA